MLFISPALRMTRYEPHVATQKLFKNLLYGWLLLHTSLLLPYASIVWGPDALVSRAPFDGRILDWVLRLSVHPALAEYYVFFVLFQLASLFLAITGLVPRIGSVLVFLSTTNLNELCGTILDGGNNLAQLMAFYLVFVNTTGRPTSKLRSPRPFRVAFSNAAFMACRIQLAIVYLVAALSKVDGPIWQSGMALYYILQVDIYSHPFVAEIIVNSPMVSFFGSYMTVAFQLSFPFLCWSRLTRGPLLIVGLLLHLGIATAMGLFTFGVVMMVMLTLFFDPRWSKAILLALDSSNIRLIVAEVGARSRWLLAIVRFLDLRRCVVIEVTEEGLRTLTSGIAVYRHGRLVGKGIVGLLILAAKIPLLICLMPFVIPGCLVYAGRCVLRTLCGSSLGRRRCIDRSQLVSLLKVLRKREEVVDRRESCSSRTRRDD